MDYSCETCMYGKKTMFEEPCKDCKFNNGVWDKWKPICRLGKLERHREICEEIHDLYEEKNHDYGDSFAKGFREYGLIMPVIRLEDKFNRFKQLVDREGLVKNESVEDTLIDLANYAIMTVLEMREGE